jgi:thioredoxin 1
MLLCYTRFSIYRDHILKTQLFQTHRIQRITIHLSRPTLPVIFQQSITWEGHITTKGITMFDTPLHVSDANFEKTVLKSTTPVIVDFWAPWCTPCKMIAPILEKFAKEFAGQLLVAKVNTDDDPEWAQKYDVQGIPTLLFVAGGKIVHRQVGVLSERALREAVQQFIEVAAQN